VQRTLHTNGQKRTLYTNRNELYTHFGGANFTHDSTCELYTRFLKSCILIPKEIKAPKEIKLIEDESCFLLKFY